MIKYTTDFTNPSIDICWTTTPYTPDTLKQVPYIEMFGFQQDWSAMITSINTWFTRFRSVSQRGGNPYKNLYKGTFHSAYKLPYLQEYHHNISQSWTENSAPFGSKAEEITEYARKAAAAFLPSAGILYPKSYTGSAPASYSVSFDLINTYAGNGRDIERNIRNNKHFVESFINSNLHGQNGTLSISPPLIYEIYIPGVRWSPAAYVSGLTVNNKGTMNVNSGKNILESLPANYIYPDAWDVTITITELINESRSIWGDAKGDHASAAANNIRTRSIKRDK